MSSLLDRVRYTVTQGTRIAWYMGHYRAARKFYAEATDADDPVPQPTGPVPGRNRMMRDLANLFRRDLQNVERGIYPEPMNDDIGPRRMLAQSRKFFADLPETTQRRRNGNAREVLTEETQRTLPGYFLQNFHFQSGGYLTEGSAEIYDMQVEVLFSGAAGAMRRQALVPVHDHVIGRRQNELHLLDVACGTGRFLGSVKSAFPRLNVLGIDLSHAYSMASNQHLASRRSAHVATANAEQLPLRDASRDIATCIYLFHELPPKVRRIVAGELARVLKPGGRLVLVDSLQFGDAPDYDGLLELFPARFHEPFYSTYVEEDLVGMFENRGLAFVSSDVAFMSKILTFDKPL
jgi:ubiquinone/menaquinone biosynthesis C-methylase UbiE